jgi:FtsH-binding integral membrane protein
MKKLPFHKKTFVLVSISLLLSLVFSGWLLQENGPWDFFVFIFIGLPLNIVLLIATLYTARN